MSEVAATHRRLSLFLSPFGAIIAEGVVIDLSPSSFCGQNAVVELVETLAMGEILWWWFRQAQPPRLLNHYD